MVQSEVSWIKEYDVAHRGLFVPGSVREENTLPAIRYAVERGFAVEIDVRITADGAIVVFHDETLDRLTEETGAVSLKSYRELQKVPVKHTGQPMPMLSDVLDIVNYKVPLYIEVKSDEAADIQALCASIRHALEGYKRHVAIMSFDKRVVKWFQRFDPAITRGLVIGRKTLLSISSRARLYWALKRLKPHFLACDIHLLPNPLTQSWRKNNKPVLTWTIRDEKMIPIGRQYADRLIFEEAVLNGLAYTTPDKP